MQTLDEFSRVMCQLFDFDKIHSRMSVYALDEERQFFYLSGRHSKDLELTKHRRLKYPVDQGVLGKALRSDERCHLGNINADPNVDIRRYCQELLNDYNIPEVVAEAFRMKSRSLFAVVIENDKTQPIAAIVCENTEVNGVPEKIQKVIMNLRPMFSPLIESKCLVLSRTFAKEREM